MDLLIKTDHLSDHRDVISQSGHSPQFDGKTKKLATEILSRFDLAPFSPPPLTELKNDYDSEIIQALINKGDLILTSEDIAFRKQDYELMLSELSKYFMRNGSIALNQVRDMFQTSRKYALSFLEYLDKKGITARDGDKRTFRDIDKVKVTLYNTARLPRR
jgi:selenocysteine-specific elongation factor